MQIVESTRANEIVRLSKLVDSQNKSLESQQKHIEFLNLIKSEKLNDAILKYEALSNEIELNQEALKNLNTDSSKLPEEVSHFLQRSRNAMGLSTESNTSE